MSEPVVEIDPRACAHCGRSKPANRHRSCSKYCAGALRRRATYERLVRAVSCHNEGLSWDEVAVKLGYSLPALARALYRYGLESAGSDVSRHIRAS